MGLERMIDANLNRVCEGLRVIEDCMRFVHEDEKLQKDIRELKHDIRKTLDSTAFINSRKALEDVGLAVSQTTLLDHKNSFSQMITANFKRVEEGLRSIEEALKVLGLNQKSKMYEAYRFKSYDLEKAVVSLKRFPETDIYGILCEDLSGGKSNIEIAKALIESGVKIIQYREKEKSKMERLKDCHAIKALTANTDCLFIVNDDLDIALLCDADGLHLGQDDLPIKEARKLAPHLLIGVSTHCIEQAMKAVEEGADYIGVGPVFKTQTKKNIEKSDGLAYVKWVSQHIHIPHVCIGGINSNNIESVKENGGRCFAMISELVSSQDINQKVVDIRACLQNIKGDEHIA